ncbi:MAG TPA: hypothetical protein VGW38_08905 [Chloroflexota bacterium]|nr:hypothetical protein [Chloroflexota bacterium]
MLAILGGSQCDRVVQIIRCGNDDQIDVGSLDEPLPTRLKRRIWQVQLIAQRLDPLSAAGAQHRNFQCRRQLMDNPRVVCAPSRTDDTYPDGPLTLGRMGAHLRLHYYGSGL